MKRTLYCLINMSIIASINIAHSQNNVSNSQTKIKRAIVIGATSGMGRQVAKLLATKGGYEVGLVGRRINLLKSLQNEIPTKTYIKQIDVSLYDQSKKQLIELIEEMGGLDLMLISVASSNDSKLSKYENDVKTIEVTLVGFWQMANIALEIFEKQKSGHLVGISSISGVRGDAKCPVYCGAKAFISTYLEGVRNYMIQKNIPVYVTDIMPGWVDTEEVKYSEMPGTYWVTPLEKAGKQIFEAIQSKQKIAYISKRQIFVKLALNIVPDIVYNAIGGF